MPDKDPTSIKELQALLGKGTEFDGKLLFQGRVRIDGKLTGHIAGDDLLILGPTAEIHANIEVGTLIVRGGAIWGEIKALRLVELYAPAKVHGNIATAQLYLDKGVTFEGHCTMLDTAEAKPEAKSDPKSDPKLDAHGEAKSDPKPAASPDPKPGASPEPKPES